MHRFPASLVLTLLSTFLGVLAIPLTLEATTQQFSKRDNTNDMQVFKLAIFGLNKEAVFYVGDYDYFHTILDQRNADEEDSGRPYLKPEHVHSVSAKFGTHKSKFYIKVSNEEDRNKLFNDLIESNQDCVTNRDFVYDSTKWLVEKGRMYKEVASGEQIQLNDLAELGKGFLAFFQKLEKEEYGPAGQSLLTIDLSAKAVGTRKDPISPPHAPLDSRGGPASLPATSLRVSDNMKDDSPALPLDVPVKILCTGDSALILLLGENRGFKAENNPLVGSTEPNLKGREIKRPEGFSEGKVFDLELDMEKLRMKELERKQRKLKGGEGTRKAVKLSLTSGARASFEDHAAMWRAFDKIRSIRANEHQEFIEKAVKALVDDRELLDLQGMLYTPDTYKLIDWKKLGYQVEAASRRQRKGKA